MIAKRSSLVTALLLALPSTALALGLGSIRVTSHLDQPLDASIPLLGVAPGALPSLSVGLASRAAFAQYGLTRPGFLSGTRIKAVPGPHGRMLLHVTSTQPVSDPIVTLLIKASWDRGVLYREYTILLNPPTYLPRASEPRHVVVAAPAVGLAARSGSLAPPSTTPVAPAVAPAVTNVAARRVHVRPGDTLSGIASRYSRYGMNSTRTRQWMVAIYRLNPQAFDHNMNLLRAGTVLQIPAAHAVAAVSGASAWQEVNRQDSAWHAALQATGAARLRLVAPRHNALSAQAGRQGAVRALQARVTRLQKALAREKRLLQIKSAALARVEAQMARSTARPPMRPHPAVAVHPVHAPVPAVARTAVPGMLARTLRRYWWALLVLLGLAAAYVLARVLRVRRESAADELLSESSEARPGPVPVPTFNPPPRAEPAIDVRESTHEQPRLVLPDSDRPVVTQHVPVDQTMSSETALNLEQGDPLAEADFHMAYGLYDQAADLIRIAIQREPERQDLKLKLLEVFFVWGNKEQFVETAHELAASREHTAASDWDKVLIMGRQLAPDDPLFAGTAVSGAAAQGVDLDLEGGQARVDFDLMSSAVPAMRTGETAGGGAGTGSFDLDIGAALGEEEVSAPGAGTDVNEIAPEFETTSETGITREMNQHPSEPTGTYTPVEPTVEQPALNLGGQSALRQKVEALSQSQGSERTAELAIDDLGLDLGTFETTVQPGLGADAPTMVTSLDEQARGLLEKTAGDLQSPDSADVPSSTGTTNAWQIDERELESLLAESPGFDTAQTSRLNALENPEVDFNLGADVAKPKRAEGNGADAHGGGDGIDFDIGTATVPHANIGAVQAVQSEGDATGLEEPVSPSEVGTKLDLARAYMDMGDPDGARSILEEVMHEGSAVQRQEAGRLLESLPG